MSGSHEVVAALGTGAPKLERRWVYLDQLEPVGEVQYVDDGTTVTRRISYVYNSQRHAPDYMVVTGADAGTYRIVTDHLGSVRLVVNASCAATTNVFATCVKQRLDYDEFGRVLTDTNPGFQSMGFAGGIFDKDTQWARFGARDYDAYTGRWTAMDPILFEGGQGNLYQYVGNAPMSKIDPIGTSPQRTREQCAYITLGMGFVCYVALCPEMTPIFRPVVCFAVLAGMANLCNDLPSSTPPSELSICEPPQEQLMSGG